MNSHTSFLSPQTVLHKKYMKFRIFFTTKNLNKLNDPSTQRSPTYANIWQQIIKYDKKWQKYDKNEHFYFFIGSGVKKSSRMGHSFFLYL